MKRTKHILWVFPIFVVALLSLLYQAGASQVTIALLKKKLANQYGLSEKVIETYARLLPQGWKIGDPIRFEAAPHSHALPQGATVVDGEDTGVVLTFAHMGDGDFPGQDEPLQTTYFVVNNTRQSTTGTIEFFQDDGSPLQLEIDGVTDSSFPFSLGRGNQQRFTTSGGGALKGGWARIRSQQPVAVNSTFGAIRQDGTVITDVGVGESELGTEFTIFADSVGSSNTGFALTNPSDDMSVDILATLRSADGAVVAQESIFLGPRQHIAQFLNELFPGVQGIFRFEGTLVFESTSPLPAAPVENAAPGPAGQGSLVPFAGLTLRISGSIFTSVPMVPPPAPDADFTRLAFPQAADGELGGLSVSTTPVLINNTDEPAAGVIEFFKGDGSPNTVRVEGNSTTSIPFEIPPRGVFRVDTDGVGEIAVGWARVTMDQPLAGVAIFTIKDGSGEIVAAVGVNSALLRQSFQLVVDKTRLFDTALAIVNPLEPVGFAGQNQATIRLNLKDTTGFFVGPEVTMELGPRQHRSLFIGEIFPEEDLENFEGRLEAITTTEAGDVVAALSLRSAVEKLTSLPVFPQEAAFQPSIVAQLATNLRGTTPGLRWDLHQTREHLALREVETTLAGLCLRTAQTEDTSELGVGYQDRPGSLVSLLAREVEENRLEYSLLSVTDELNLRGEGSIENVGGGVRMSFRDLKAVPASTVLLDTDIVLFFKAGLFEVCAETELIEIETSARSVSQRRRQDIPVRRRFTQSIGVTDPDPLLANTGSLDPPWLTVDQEVTIGGTNFGPQPRVLFTDRLGGTREVVPHLIAEGSLQVRVPPGIGDGPVRVDNGNGLGNAYQVPLLFAPSFSMSQQEGTDQLRLELSQENDVLSMQENYEFLLYTVAVDFDSLAIGERVGTFGEGFGERGIFVQSVSEDEAVLEVATAPSTNIVKTLVLEQIEEDLVAVRTPPGNEISEEPDLLRNRLSFLIRFESLPITFPESDEIVFGEALIYSSPTGPGGAESRITLSQSDAFPR